MSLLLAFQGAPPATPDLIFVGGELFDEQEDGDGDAVSVLVLEESAPVFGTAYEVDEELDDETISALAGHLTDAQFTDPVAILGAAGRLEADDGEESGESDEWMPGPTGAAVVISDDLVAILGPPSDGPLLDDEEADALAAYGASEFPPEPEGGDCFFHRRYRRISYR